MTSPTYRPTSATAYMPKSATPVVDSGDNPLVSAIRSAGGGTLMDLAGIASEPGRQFRQRVGLPVESNPFFTQQQKQEFQQNPGETIGSSVESDILSALLAAGVTKIGAGVAPFIPALLQGGFTKGGAAALATKAAIQGSNIDFSDILKNAKTDVISPRIQQAINEFGAQYAPENLPGLLTSPEALAIRREITNKFGPSLFEKLGGLSSKTQAAQDFRTALSGLIHEAAPGTQIPDQLYSLYSKAGIFGGDIPTLILKYGLGIPFVRKLLGPIGKSIELMKQ